MPEQIPLLDLVAQYKSIQPEIDAAIHRVLESGHFILGEEVTCLEQDVSDYLGVQHGVGVASGTDALIIALRALEIGPGHEVIIPAYTFFATVGAVLHVGATPVFVDIDPLTYCIDVAQVAKKITPQTKAVIPVHLYGHPAEMDALLDLARQHHFKIIEDNAQAFGAEYKGRKTGSLGDINCLSFFPSKNLGGYGDGGMVVTNDAGLAERVRMLRAHGWRKKYYPEILGYNSRLDALQAAILRVKLKYVDQWNDRRREMAAVYNQGLIGLSMGIPVEMPGARHVYHLYVLRVQERERMRQLLKEAGIASDVYYPQPPYLAAACQELGFQPGQFPIADKASRETLAVPLYPEMSARQQQSIKEALQKFC